jgi:hypothetical protein
MMNALAALACLLTLAALASLCSASPASTGDVTTVNVIVRSAAGEEVHLVFPADVSRRAASARGGTGACQQLSLDESDCRRLIEHAVAADRHGDELALARLHGYYDRRDDLTRSPERTADIALMERLRSQYVFADPGEAYYRAYVGRPDLYDFIGAMQFVLLVRAGLRGSHRVLELGCGALRLGRLLIPYLESERYTCIEPNAWLYQTALRFELGYATAAVKRPTFVVSANFSLIPPPPQVAGKVANKQFDFLIAYSIFTHVTHRTLHWAIGNIARLMGNTSLFLATFALHSADERHRQRQFGNSADRVGGGGGSSERGGDWDVRDNLDDVSWSDGRSRGGGGGGGISESDSFSSGDGDDVSWVYPGFVMFTRRQVLEIVRAHGLHCVELDSELSQLPPTSQDGVPLMSPVVTQTWFAIGRASVIAGLDRRVNLR